MYHFTPSSSIKRCLRQATPRSRPPSSIYSLGSSSGLTSTYMLGQTPCFTMLVRSTHHPSPQLPSTPLSWLLFQAFSPFSYSDEVASQSSPCLSLSSSPNFIRGLLPIRSRALFPASSWRRFCYAVPDEYFKIMQSRRRKPPKRSNPALGVGCWPKINDTDLSR